MSTDTDMVVWYPLDQEDFEGEPVGRLVRGRIAGGWLYKHATYDWETGAKVISTSIAFVPDPS